LPDCHSEGTWGNNLNLAEVGEVSLIVQDVTVL